MYSRSKTDPPIRPPTTRMSHALVVSMILIVYKSHASADDDLMELDEECRDIHRHMRILPSSGCYRSWISGWAMKVGKELSMARAT
jgi:hypothetical protein